MDLEAGWIWRLGPVGQSIATRLLRRQLVKYMPTTLSNTLLFFLRRQLVKYMPTTLSNTLLFFVEKM